MGAGGFQILVTLNPELNMKIRNSGPQRFVMLGLGSFGTACALRLARNGSRVTGVDISPTAIEELQSDLYEAVTGDATDIELLKALDLPNTTSVVISLGEDITRSIFAALHAKELGAKHLIAKGVSKDHGRLLSLIGIDRVVYPEKEMAIQLADHLTWPNLIDFARIGQKYGFVEVMVPGCLVGKSVKDPALEKLGELWVVGVRDMATAELMMFPGPELVLTEEHLILAVGLEECLRELCDLP